MHGFESVADLESDGGADNRLVDLREGAAGDQRPGAAGGEEIRGGADDRRTAIEIAEGDRRDIGNAGIALQAPQDAAGNELEGGWLEIDAGQEELGRAARRADDEVEGRCGGGAAAAERALLGADRDAEANGEGDQQGDGEEAGEAAADLAEEE